MRGIGKRSSVSALEFLRGTEVPERIVYLLTGEDDFLLERVSRYLRDNLLEPSLADFNYGLIRCKPNTRLEQLLDALAELPVMASQRVLELREVSVLPDNIISELLEALLELEMGGGLRVVVGWGCGATRKYAQKSIPSELLKMSFEIRCRAEPKEIPAWLAAQARQKGLLLGRSGLQTLLLRTGGDLRALSSNLDILASYVGKGKAKNKALSSSDIEALIPLSASVQTWRLTSAIGNGDFTEAARLVEQLIFQGESPGALLSYLNSYINSLLKVRKLYDQTRSISEVARALPRKKEYQIKKTVEELTTWSLSDLELAWEMLYRADLRIKHGVDPALVLQLMVFRLCARKGIRRKRNTGFSRVRRG